MYTAEIPKIIYLISFKRIEDYDLSGCYFLLFGCRPDVRRQPRLKWWTPSGPPIAKDPGRRIGSDADLLAMIAGQQFDLAVLPAHEVADMAAADARQHDDVAGLRLGDLLAVAQIGSRGAGTGAVAAGLLLDEIDEIRAPARALPGRVAAEIAAGDRQGLRSGPSPEHGSGCSTGPRPRGRVACQGGILVDDARRSRRLHTNGGQDGRRKGKRKTPITPQLKLTHVTSHHC